MTEPHISDSDLFPSPDQDPVDSKKIMKGFGLVLLLIASPFILFFLLGIGFFIVLMLGFASDSLKSSNFINLIFYFIFFMNWVPPVAVLCYQFRKTKRSKVVKSERDS